MSCLIVARSLGSDGNNGGSGKVSSRYSSIAIDSATTNPIVVNNGYLSKGIYLPEIPAQLPH